MLPGVYTPKSSSSTPFSYKKHLKTSHLGSIRKNHFKIPHILQKAGSQLKIFLHVPLREISISFRGQEWGPGGRFFSIYPAAQPHQYYYPVMPHQIYYLLSPTDATILLHTTDAAIHNGCHYLQSPHPPRKNRPGHLHHIRCKRPGPYMS